MKTENYCGLLYQNMECLFREGRFADREIVLFGRNATSLGMQDFLEAHDLHAAAFIDNNRRKEGTFAPEEYLLPVRETVLILIASKYFPQMREQLLKIGYNDSQIIQVVDFYDVDGILKLNRFDSRKEMSTAQIREKQMKIADRIFQICDEMGLRCSLSGGTLLGAIRHGGYIPWDDDIDLMLPYPDYRKLLEALRKDSVLKPISVMEPDQEFPMFFARVEAPDTVTKMWEFPFLYTTGIYVDLFPIWGLPSDSEKRLAHVDEILSLKTSLLESYVRHPFPDDQVLAERDGIVKRAFELIEEIPFGDAEYAGYVASKYGVKDIIPTSIYDEMRDVPFENRTYRMVGGYDIYLTSLYGDYMKPPEEGSRGTTHSFRAFYR